MLSKRKEKSEKCSMWNILEGREADLNENV